MVGRFNDLGGSSEARSSSLSPGLGFTWTHQIKTYRFQNLYEDMLRRKPKKVCDLGLR